MIFSPLPEAVQARGRAFVTGTVFGGRETLRACILHPDTSSEHLATLIAEVVDGLAHNGDEGDAQVEARVRGRVEDLCARFPIYPEM